jgi:hypothetical protein
MSVFKIRSLRPRSTSTLRCSSSRRRDRRVCPSGPDGQHRAPYPCSMRARHRRKSECLTRKARECEEHAACCRRKMETQRDHANRAARNAEMSMEAGRRRDPRSPCRSSGAGHADMTMPERMDDVRREPRRADDGERIGQARLMPHPDRDALLGIGFRETSSPRLRHPKRPLPRPPRRGGARKIRTADRRSGHAGRVSPR